MVKPDIRCDLSGFDEANVDINDNKCVPRIVCPKVVSAVHRVYSLHKNGQDFLNILWNKWTNF